MPPATGTPPAKSDAKCQTDTVDTSELEPQTPPELLPQKTTLGKRLLKVLLLLGMGVGSMQRLTDITESELEWKEFKLALLSRVGNVNVVSALILASTAAFLTTTPGTSIANWSHPVPYIALLGAFCLAYLGVGSGTFLLFVLMDVQSQSLRNLLGNTKIQVGVAMGLMAAPVLFVGASGGIAIVGLFAAVWLGNDPYAKAVLTVTMVSVISLIFGFAVTVILGGR